MPENTEKNKNDYKVIISELGVNPLRVVNIIFALMCVIPLLALFYIIIGKNFLYDLLVGSNGVEVLASIIIAFSGLLYAYNLVRNLIKKLLMYSEERRLADEEKSEFMMSVSRDLRIPVEVIKFEVGNIMAGIGEIAGGIIGDTVKKCVNASNRLLDLIEKVTDFPGTGFARTNVRREFVNFNNVVKAEVDGAMSMAKQKNLSLRYTPISKEAKLWGDEKKLSKAAMKLISSIIKYTPDGGIINVAILSDVNTIQFSVVNTPSELLPEGIGNIFENSYKPDNYSGIEDAAADLSMVKDIVNLHNGHITMNRFQEKQAEFKITLPCDLRTRAGILEDKPNLLGAATRAENEDMWLALNDVLQKIVSRSKEKNFTNKTPPPEI